MYQEKFYHQYCDKYGNTHRVAIHEWDYEGPTTEVECGYQQILVGRENTNEIKMGGIYPTRATATFRTQPGFDLEELFTGDERSYRLVWTTNSQPKWIGNVVPDGFTRATWDAVHSSDLVVKATDNLATLQGKPFTNSDGGNYGNVDDPMHSFLWVLVEGLKKTGLELPIRTLVDLKTLIDIPTEEIVEPMVKGGDNYFGTVIILTPARVSELTEVIRPQRKIRITDGPFIGLEFTVKIVWPTAIGGDQYMLTVVTEEFLPSGLAFSEFEVFEDNTPDGVVMARITAFNEYDPSEVGFFKQGVNLDFIQPGDTVKITSDAPDNISPNTGLYTVTGVVHSVPPDDPYVRIQLDPPVPVTESRSVILEVISNAVEHPDPLYHTYHDVRTWVRDSIIKGKSYYEASGGAMTTWEVMDAIARQWGVIICQNEGRWEILRWNAFRFASGQHSWFLYDSEGAPTGRAPFGDTVTLPCLPTETASRVYGTVLQMDRVLSNAIVNYRFKYNQEGDSLANLIVNGNFEGALNPDPRDWRRVRADDVSYSTIPAMELTSLFSGLPPGFTSGLRIKNYANSRSISNLTPASESVVNAGDDLVIYWWERRDGAASVGSSAVYSIAIYARLDDAYESSEYPPTSPRYRQEVHHLRLSKIVTGRGAPNSGEDTFEGAWQRVGAGLTNDDPAEFFRFQTTAPNPVTLPASGWRKVTVVARKAPINGYLKFEVFGLAKDNWVYGNAIRKVPVFKPGVSPYSGRSSGGRRNVRVGGAATQSTIEAGFLAMMRPEDNVALEVTGFFVGRILDTGSDAVPQIDSFMYPEPEVTLQRRYTDTIPEIEVLTGDDYGEFAADRVSGMWWSGVRTSMWDTWDDRFGWSRQGLITAKSIMEMYWEPTRLLEIELNIDGMHWTKRIQFQELPGLTFAVLRGGISAPDGGFKGTLTQVFSSTDTPLPPGGVDGGEHADPNWQPTGVQRCRRDRSGLNTGYMETEEVDTNTASPTYGQERWVLGDMDTDSCPIGMPPDLYWGASGLPIDVSILQTFPVQKDGNEYIVAFDNDDTGKYLVLLHRAALGTIQSIIYIDVPYEAYDVPDSSWEYQADITLNGVVYKTIRQKYATGVLDKMPLSFTIV